MQNNSNNDVAMQDRLEAFEHYLAVPVKNVAEQSFGINSEKLREKFVSFQKELKGEKLFREYLHATIEKKRIAEALRLKNIGKENGYNKFAKDSDIYKAAGISKYVFSKIMNYRLDPPHRPSEETVAALTIGLELDIEEAEEFYYMAGYSLGETEFLDKVVRFFIKEKVYNIYEVTDLLDHYGHPPLGDKIREKETKKNL